MHCMRVHLQVFMFSVPLEGCREEGLYRLAHFLPTESLYLSVRAVVTKLFEVTLQNGVVFEIYLSC